MTTRIIDEGNTVVIERQHEPFVAYFDGDWGQGTVLLTLESTTSPAVAQVLVSIDDLRTVVEHFDG